MGEYATGASCEWRFIRESPTRFWSRSMRSLGQGSDEVPGFGATPNVMPDRVESSAQSVMVFASFDSIGTLGIPML